MTCEPKVTGLSPMTGPPGTKVTVRGENLGQSAEDIIELTINGDDCLPYLEWKSPKKIITRCTKTLGSGDIIITTNSGGVGTCDVQFNCYEEVVGPNDESAVWFEEIECKLPEKETLAAAAASTDSHSLEFSSSRFKPQHYLLSKHPHKNLHDLESLHRDLSSLLSKLQSNTSSTGTDSLKSDLPVIMECLHILEHLSKIITISRDTSIDNIVRSIKQSLSSTHKVFSPLLAQKDLVQSIEDAMQVFIQNENLFNLPSAIENSIKTRNFDMAVKEVSVMLPRIKSINHEGALSKKIQLDILTKVDELKTTIENQLHQSCESANTDRSIDEVKKLVSHLNRLQSPIIYDIWIIIQEMRQSLIRTMTDKFNYFLMQSLNQNAHQHESADETPHVVHFVQNALNLFNSTYYDLLNLGQCYFDHKDEFACNESENIRHTRQVEFEEMIVPEPITHLCKLLRLALVPESPKLEDPSRWQTNENEMTTNLLKDILQSVILCHINLTKLINLPPTARVALDDFREFIFELRVRFMQVLFGNVTRSNKNLREFEDWFTDVGDLHGGTTKLPLAFEKNVIETLRFANETIFKISLPDEQSILKRHDVQASMKELAQSLINSLLDSLDNALIESSEYPHEFTKSLLASRYSNRPMSKYCNRLLITISNCQFTMDQIFPRLQDEFEKLQGLKMDRVFKKCGEKYCDYIKKTCDKFCRIKCSELKKVARNSQTPKIDDLQINLMVVNAQIFFVAPQLVDTLMTSIVNLLIQERTLEVSG